MDLSWIWKAFLIVLGGTFLLRLAGRKSVAQMTLAPTVIMISIGSLLIQPVSGRNIWTTLAVGLLLIGILLVLEYAQVKSDKLEGLITGKSKVVIDNGIINVKNLKKMRITVDQLEMQLRQGNVSNITDVKWATIEPNGQLGFLLKEDSQTVTKKEFNQVLQELQSLRNLIQAKIPDTKVITTQSKIQPALQPVYTFQVPKTPELFNEVQNPKSSEGKVPDYLQ